MSKYSVVFKLTAVKDIKKLPIQVRKRIAAKLDFYVNQKNPLDYAVKLSGSGKAGNYRFRVGQYRIVFDVSGNALVVLYVEHRREVYRRK